MRNFKKLILPIALVIVLAVVNMGMNYALIPYSYVRIMMHEIQVQDHDTVFLGTSHGLNGISPKIIDEKTGRKSINLCMGGEYPQDAYYLLKQACKRNIPRTVVYELDAGYWCTPVGQRGDFNRIYYEMPFSEIKLEYFVSKVAELDFRATLFPWFYYRGQFKNVKQILECKQGEDYKNYGAEAFQNGGQSYADGFLRNEQVFGTKSEQELELWNEETKNEDSFRYFEKMVSFCEKNNIELIVVVTPVPQETLEKYKEKFQATDEFFSAYMKQAGVSYWNYNDPERKIKNFDDSLNAFTDYEGHMNVWQAESFSAQLAEDFL